MRECRKIIVLSVALSLAGSGLVLAQEPPERASHIDAKTFRHPDLTIPAFHPSVDEMRTYDANEARRTGIRLDRLGVVSSSARVDHRSGRFATLLPTVPLLPGTGVGNDLQWDDVSTAVPQSDDELGRLAWDALNDYLSVHQDALELELHELAPDYRFAVHRGGELIQIHAPRQIDGIPVRGSHLSAVIGQGNLTLMSFNLWGDRPGIVGRPSYNADRALKAVEEYLSFLPVERQWGKTELLYLPMAMGQQRDAVTFGDGLDYRLAWSVKVQVPGDMGHWEALVDAKSGELLAFEDQNQYAEATGGVLPVTNDGIVPDGVEQPGWPMPFLNVTTGSGTLTTDTGGNLTAAGSLTASLTGPYVRMNDNCGSISLTQNDNLDFGASSGTDCVTPGFGGAGNTHASRTGFYELNKVIEMGRGQLPTNTWLQNQLTSNMNINSTCNAFWNGTVNFYRSGGGCFNTGEIAGVFDHEWGHGMDANDVNGGIASPSGEGIADVYTALRLNTSCIGRNFRSTVCTGNGDPCLTCTGVRDIDYLKRQSGNPHDYTWSNANCGGSVHCVGGVYSEAVWSLWKRKLQSAPYNYDNNTAHEITTRLTYIGAGATSTWFSGGPPNGGCAGSSGYMNYLAADDDNGNLNDGTPHMNAIFDAFNDQEIACATPTVQDSGCAGTPSSAPTVNTSAGNQQISLTWNAIAGASSYGVYRTEGVFACDFGKVKLGETSGTSWNDSDLQNGRDYSYVVIPMGSSASCFGPASACATDQPVGQPDFAISCSPSSQALSQGDSGSATCTVISSFGYTGTVNLSCSGNPSGIGCGLSPSSVSVPANGSVGSTASFTVDMAQATGTFAFDIEATDGTLTRPAGVSIQVIPFGSNGPQDAVYDAGLGAPKCNVAGSECDSNDLLDGRANLGPEVNQPNTLDSCTDGTSGTYHSDESNDRIVVRTLDGGNLTEGVTAEVAVTVWAWSTGSSDTLDLYYADDANSPSWTLLGSFVPGGGGVQTITTQYTLPTGSMQAIRANFRYQGSQSSCTTGSYDDADDLVFTVASAGPGCTIDAECDNGLYCDGAETCNAGTCQAGSAPTCDDGVSCTIDSCNEGTDSCDFTTDDSICDNGLFCDGTETCDAVLGCQAGSAPTCDDGVNCTVDSCNEGTDSCDFSPNDAICDNGLFCDGTESCDVILGCQAGSDPCGGLFCDEVGDVCDSGGTPVTVTYTSIAAEDGWTRESNETSDVGGAANSGGKGSRPIRPGDGTQDRQYKSILSFDTSSIPAGATIQSATLRLRRGTVRGSDPFTNGFGQCLVDVQNGGFSGNTALQASDFQAVATATAAASLTAPAANGDWSEGVLNPSGLSAINNSGTTQFRVYFQVDDNDDGGDDHMGYYSGDHSNAANHPQLVVTYVE